MMGNAKESDADNWIPNSVHRVGRAKSQSRILHDKTNQLFDLSARNNPENAKALTH